MILSGRRGADPYKKKSKYSQHTKQKIYTSFRQRFCSIHARPSFSSRRADNACTNLLGFFVWYVRTRGIAETVESGKTADFRSVLCRTHLPRMACATNSCTRKEIFKRMENPLK